MAQVKTEQQQNRVDNGLVSDDLAYIQTVKKCLYLYMHVYVNISGTDWNMLHT